MKFIAKSLAFAEKFKLVHLDPSQTTKLPLSLTGKSYNINITYTHRFKQHFISKEFFFRNLDESNTKYF